MDGVIVHAKCVSVAKTEEGTEVRFYHARALGCLTLRFRDRPATEYVPGKEYTVTVRVEE